MKGNGCLHSWIRFFSWQGQVQVERVRKHLTCWPFQGGLWLHCASLPSANQRIWVLIPGEVHQISQSPWWTICSKQHSRARGPGKRLRLPGPWGMRIWIYCTFSGTNPPHCFILIGYISDIYYLCYIYVINLSCLNHLWGSYSTLFDHVGHLFPLGPFPSSASCQDHVFSSALDAMETALKMVRWFQSSRFWRCKA